MKRAKKLYPRRVRALRMAAIALSLLLFCNYVLHIGFLLPIQALRACEQLKGVYERTQVVQRRLEPGMIHLIDVLYLTEGENSLSLFCTHPTLLGWMDAFVCPVDTSDGGDVQAGAVWMGRDGRENLIVFYGRVKGTEDVHLDAYVRTEEWDDAENGVHTCFYGRGIGEEDRLVRDGYTYFIFIEPNPVPEDARNRLLAYYQIIFNHGGEHIEYEIEQTASVFWG